MFNPIKNWTKTQLYLLVLRDICWDVRAWARNTYVAIYISLLRKPVYLVKHYNDNKRLKKSTLDVKLLPHLRDMEQHVTR